MYHNLQINDMNCIRARKIRSLIPVIVYLVCFIIVRTLCLSYAMFVFVYVFMLFEP